MRLLTGQGARIARDGATQRLVSIQANQFPRTVQQALSASSRKPVICGISDNIREPGAGPFYEIVHGGLDEDVLAYVDRPYEWNGMTSVGMPEFLVGADYVKTFNDDKRRSFQVTVVLAQRCDLYIFWDNHVAPADWLKEGFTDTGFDIGIDEVTDEGNRDLPGVIGVGPGVEVDKKYSIWHRRVSMSGIVTLGPISRDQHSISMYGIAAVPAPPASEDISNRRDRP